MLKKIKSFAKDVAKKILSLIRSLLVYFFVGVFFMIILGGVGRFFSSDVSSANFVREKIIKNTGGENKIIYVKLSGMILSENTPGVFSASTGIITPDKIRQILTQIRNDSLAKAVIFDINSPGGSPVASDRIFEQIINFKNETKIPIVVLMGDMAASGGYYIASPADHIVANPATITGSIGVILETYNLEGLYEKLGLEKITFKKGEYKDILNESREISEEEKAMLDKLNQDSYDMFIERVAQGRAMDKNEVIQIADGKIYSGKQALKLNLVDSLGNLDEAENQAKNLAQINNYKLVEYDFSTVFGELFGEIKSGLKPSFNLPSQILRRR